MTREGKEPMAPAPSAPCEPSAPAEPSAPGEPSSAEPVGEQHESHAEKLTYESFCKLAREREGVAASDVELRARFAALDLDGSGKADLNEYNCHCLREALRRSSSRVIDLFRSWDVDGSGEVDREEFRRAIRQLNLDYVADDAAIDRMFALFDDDDNGTLEYHELRKQLSVGAGKTLEPLLRPGAVDLGPSGLKHRLRRRDSIAKGTKMVRRASVDLRGSQTVQEQLKAVLRANAARVIDLFREWDDDGNGTISKKEFRQGLRLFGLDADRGELDALFDALDKDGGGTLDFKELDKALRNETEEELDGRLKASAASRRLAKSMDAVSSKNWQMYQLKQKACKMLAAKDRGLPMAAAARSTRHVLEHSKRIVPPAKPKPATKAKRKDVEGGLRTSLLADDGPKGLWGWVQHIFAEFRQAMAMILNGLLEQELEVQMFAAFLLVSALVSLYTEAESVVALSQYESGRAPPAPPAHPDWTVTVTDSAMGFALSSPLAYLLVDFGTATFLGVLYYWWEDIKAWNRARLLRASKGGYQLLGSQPGAAVRKAVALIDAEEGGGPAAPPVLATEADLQREISREIDKVEELETKLKVHTASGSPHVATLAQRAELHRERLSLLKEALVNMAGDLAEKQKAEAKDAPPPTRGGLISEIGNSGFIKVLKNSMTGFVSVYLFYVDVLSDVQVVVLLWDTGNWLWCAAAAFFLVAQYMVVYTRVLPYMRNTFGASSCLTCSFTYLGFPLGLFILDFLMLLEPFGLLAVLPLPAWLKQFVPAYKATRVITEIAIESLPQCLLQSYILIVVMRANQMGTTNPHLIAMVDDAAVMPKSITISTVAILKTWMEVVQQSREAGISVQTKASQLWHVGAGLPLDALKKGSIVEWACTYTLDKAEVPPLVDALIKNTSLRRLGLAEAGLEWDAAKGSAAQLVDAMGKNPAALSGLQKLTVSSESRFELPMGELRGGPEKALAALEACSFFAPGQGHGPWRVDLIVCGDVLRRNGNRLLTTESEQGVGEEVQRLIEDVQGGLIERSVWERRTKQLMAGGDLRRSQLQLLVGAECLRGVGFRAAELLACGFRLVELKNGFFTVGQLREAGVAVRDLSAARYSAAEMHEGGVSAAELRPLEYTPFTLREGGYSASEVRTAKYPLAELRGVYTAGELREAEVPAAEMRKVGFEVSELRLASWNAELLRKGGYSAAEMREGGYSANVTHEAGYSATEATAAGWSLEQLKQAGYDAHGLRQARHPAKAMREAGFTPAEMRQAQYPTQELYEAGYGCEELRRAGTPIADLTAAGATIAEMKASGISAGGLKIENVRLKDMRLGGYTAKEVKAAGYSCDQVKKAGFVEGLKAGGYTIGEAVAAKYSCAELYVGGYSAEELLVAGFAPLEMRAVGYDAKVLQAAGVTLPKLRAAGVSVADLRGAGFSCGELLLVGVKADELHAAGASAAELKEAGFPLLEFHTIYPVGELRGCGFSCEELRVCGFSAKSLLAIGATTRELRDGMYTAGELREVGATAKELKALRYRCDELKECGFTARDLVNVGFDSYALKMGGYRPRHVKECGFKGSSVFGLAELKADGFGVTELWKDEGFTLHQLSTCFSVGELRVEGEVKAEELLEVGFSLTQMRDGGYECAELYQAGYAVEDMKTAGYTCTEVREAGFVEGIKAAGYTCKEARAAGYGENLKRAGYSVLDLKKAGCTFSEVKAAGFIKGLKEAGFTCRDAKLARFPPRLLRTAGYECAEARAAGFGPDLKAAGFTVQEAKAAGCTVEQVKEAGYIEGICEAGYTIEECFEAIFSCEQARRAGFVEGFKAAGYSITEAKVAGFTAEGLRAAGYSCEDVKIAQFSCKKAREAGYTAKEARAAGWTWAEIADAGYALRPEGAAPSSAAAMPAAPPAPPPPKLANDKATGLRRV